MVSLRKIFWAFILLFFTITINNGATKIVLLPAFVGYLIIMINARKLSSFSKHLSKVSTPLIILSVFSALSFLLSLSGSDMSTVDIVGSIVSTGIYLWMLYLMLYGFNDIARVYGLEFEGKQFTLLFPWLAGMQLISMFFLLVFPLIAIIASLLELAVHIVFLVRLARFSNLNFTLPVSSNGLNQS
jgi:hypothetical protein